MNKISLALTAARELGLRKLLLLTAYRVGLGSGHYLRSTPAPIPHPTIPNPAFKAYFGAPDIKHINSLHFEEADRLCQGQISLFGGEPVPLNLTSQPLRVHWTAYERGLATWGEEDIKYIWEPARFSWAFQLARAYALQPNPSYARAFWRYFEQFQLSNPAYTGPNWISAQEAALRILAFTFCASIFSEAEDTTPERLQALAILVAEHADRIPPTLVYARSQNNNHLLSEAVGLFTAAQFLPDHPHAIRWKKLGWKWFNWGIQNQINSNGSYIQHSVNYHRLMLQLALWMHALTNKPNTQPLPETTLTRLAAATRWLWALMDPDTGGVPNLGANDGALILPLTDSAHNDYRPILQAAGLAFLHKRLLQTGPWDELADWLDINLGKELTSEPQPQAIDMPRCETSVGHAFLRTAHFSDRPSHADQLHVDLWFRGENITLDAGSYSYNSAPPWQNALSSTLVHNTVSLNDLDQMTLVSRFLWLHWAQAKILENMVGVEDNLIAIKASHNGYDNLGWRHQRLLAARQENTWVVDDLLIPTTKHPKTITARLAWLLPDVPWQVEDSKFIFNFQKSRLTLSITGANDLAIVRAGTCIYGSLKSKAIWGWYSPTYGVKNPALQLIATTQESIKPFFSTVFSFAET